MASPYGNQKTGDFSGTATADSLMSQFSRVKAPKSYSGGILDPVKPVPVQGSIGGTGVDMSPLLTDMGQRRNLAIANASHKLAVAQMAQEGEVIRANLDERARFEKAAQIQRDIENKLAMAQEQRQAKALEVDQQNVELREREIGIREADTPEARLAEDEKLQAQRIAQRRTADKQDDAEAEAKQGAKEQRRAAVNNSVRNALKSIATKGESPTLDSVIQAATAAMPEAAADPVLQNEIARSAQIAIENNLKYAKSFQDARKQEEAEAESLFEQAVAEDSSPDAMPDEDQIDRMEAMGTDLNGLIQNIVGMSDPNQENAKWFADNVREYTRGMTLFQIGMLRQQTKDSIDVITQEFAIEKENLDALLAEAKRMPESQERDRAIREYQGQLKALPAMRKAKSEPFDMAAKWLQGAAQSRTNTLATASTKQARDNGIDRYNKFYDESVMDEVAGGG